MIEIFHAIDDQNYLDHVEQHADRTGGVMGALPRVSEPGRLELRPGVFAAALDESMPLIPEAEWPDRIRAMQGQFACDRDAARKVEDTNQGHYGYCWAASLTQCVERLLADEGKSYEVLAWESLGGAVGWRNAGNSLDSAISYAAKNGIAPRPMVPAGSINPKTFKPGWQDDAMRRVPLEWFDFGSGTARVWQQTVSWILGGGRVYAAYNWWRHAVCLDGLVLDGNEVCPTGPNSWGPGQRYVLKGNKRYPSEGYAVRVISWS